MSSLWYVALGGMNAYLILWCFQLNLSCYFKKLFLWIKLLLFTMLFCWLLCCSCLKRWILYDSISNILVIILLLIFFDISPFLFVRCCLYIGNVQVSKNEGLVVVSSSWCLALIHSTRGDVDSMLFICWLLLLLVIVET